MPLLRRMDSDKTHVSDSEPEREARRSKSDNSHSSDDSSAPNSPLPRRAPLSAISNTVREGARCTIDSRLSAIEGDLAKIKDQLEVLCRSASLLSNIPCGRPLTFSFSERNRVSFISSSPPSTPPPKRARIICDQQVGPDSPVGRLEEPRIHRSSLMANTPEREELGHCFNESLQQISAPRAVSLHRPRGQQKTLTRRVTSSRRNYVVHCNLLILLAIRAHARMRINMIYSTACILHLYITLQRRKRRLPPPPRRGALDS
jgi:hypothetical protein